MTQRLKDLLQGYTQQRIPSLASRTNITSSRLEVNVKRSDATQNDESQTVFIGSDDEGYLWTSIIRLIGAYSDSSDILVVEPIHNDKEMDWKDRISTFRIKIDQNVSRKDACQSIARIRKEENIECSIEELKRASLDAGMNLAPGQSPALITIGSYSLAQENPEWYPMQGIAILINVESDSVSIIGDARIISKEMAEVLGCQVWQLYVCIKNEPSLPFKRLEGLSNDLLSQYEPAYDPEEARLPIEWLLTNARKRPEAIAHELCDEPDDENVRYLTFGQLDERSNRMSNWLLKKHKVQHGQPIGVMRKRDEFFYIAMAAILKAGCCYLPIDKDLPKERKQFIVRDSNAALLLTDQESVEDNLIDQSSFNMDDTLLQEEISQFDSIAPDVKVDLDDLAYILYTSGTSGNPKGCLLMHRGLYWAIKMFVEIPRKVTNPDTDKRLAMAAVAFDVHVSEMIQGWAIGTRLVSVSSRMSLLADLQGTIERFGITHIGMVPSMIEATLTKSPSDLPLKYITSGGEKINDKVLQKWASHPNILFANLYGPTEATIGCTARIIGGTDEPKENIGHAFIGSGAYIADSELNILPKGISGELIIEGPLVARGYLNLPDATQKNFIEWPRKGCRAYRTGDLVRMNYDGSLSIHGRIDSQIKLRGVRIESEGVSAVISNASKHRRIDAVSVICKHQAVGDSDMLVTFITPSTQKDQPGTSKSANERRGKPDVMEMEDAKLMDILRKASVEGLASYMRPSHIIPLTFFPLSHNGKIDTKPLANLFAETSMSKLMKVQGLMKEDIEVEEDSFIEPSTEIEKMVVQSIAEITGVSSSKLSMKQKLLEVGLSSLNCANLTAILRSKASIKLSVSDILACKTIADCASLITHIKSDHKSVNKQPYWNAKQFKAAHIHAVHQCIAPESAQDIYPPLPVQPGVLFHTLQDKTGYVQHFTYQIEDAKISRDLIHACWKEVQSSLDILRTVFVLDHGEAVQIVLMPDACSVPITTEAVQDDNILANKSKFEAFLNEKKVLDNAASLINNDFGSPMFSVKIFQTNDLPTKLMTVSFSHTIYDAFAVRNIMTVFDKKLSKIDVKSADHLSMTTLVDQLYSTTEQEHRTFWQSTLKGAIEERKRLSWQPLQISKRDKTRRRNRILDVALDDVQKRCSGLGVTLQTFFNVIFALSARSIFPFWQKFALFGNVRSGRNLPLMNINQAAYPLVTVVPCVIDLSSKQIDEIFKDAHSTWTKSVEHENVALSQIQIWAKSRNLVEVLFSCRIEANADRSNSYQSIKHFSTSEMDPEFPLAVEILLDQKADSIDVRIVHNPSAISSDKIDDLIRQIQTNMFAILDGEQLEISSDDSLNLIAKPAQKQEQESKVDPRQLKDIQEALSAFLKVDSHVLKPNTSLVSLGMTSLRAVAFSHSIAKSLDLHIDPIDVVQGDNINSIAQTTAKRAQNKKDKAGSDNSWSLSRDELTELGDIRTNKDDKVNLAPCTPLQAGMLAQTIASEGRLYLHAFVMELNRSDETSVDRILKVWSEAQATYGILRTSFHFLTSNGRWIQAEHSTQSCPLSILEVNEEVGESRARQLSIDHLNIKGEEGLQKPPIRLVLFRKSRLLVLALHHALYDGVSLANLFEYTTNLHKGMPLPQTPSFLHIAREIVASEDKATNYWVNRLGSVKQNVFVKARKDDGKSIQAWRDGISFNQEETESIQSFKRRYGVSAQSIGQIAYACTLFGLGQKQEPDIVFCQVVSGRTKREAGQVIGPVFNTVAIRVNLAGEVKAKEMVQQIQYENGQSLPWQHAPLRNVQRQLQKTSLSDALFLYQPNTKHENHESSTDKPWSLVTSTAEEGSTQFTLNLEFHDGSDAGGVFSVRASCAADVLSQSELRDIVHQYKSNLLDIVRSPNKVLAPGTVIAYVNGTNSTDGTGNGSCAIEDEQTIIDASLLNILTQVLRVNSTLIKSYTNLSSIGLDSIAAMQIASRFRKKGYHISPMQILRCTTVNDLISMSSTKSKPNRPSQNGKAKIEKASIRPEQDVLQSAKEFLHPSITEHVEGYIPSAGMRYLFSGWQRSGGRQFQICIGRRTHSDQRFDLDAMRKSWSALVSRHAILRSTIVPSRDDEVPLVLFVVRRDCWNGSFDIIDQREALRGTSLEEQKDQAKEFGRTLLRSPDSIQMPNSRLVILRLPEFDSFFVQMPHTHYDAFTVPHLLKELSKEYFKHSKNDEYESETAKDDLEEVEAYLTHCMLGNESDKREQDAKRQKYFQESLGRQLESHIWHDARLRESNHDVSQKPITYYIRELRKGTPTVHELQDYSQRVQLTPAAILTSTWAHVHADQMGRSSSTFAFVNSGRSAEVEGIEDLFAPTINLVPTFLDNLQSITASNEQKTALRTSIMKTAKRVQEQWKQQPSWAVQTNMSDIRKWVDPPAEQSSIFNTTLNVQIRPSKQAGSLRDTVKLEDEKNKVEESNWLPVHLQAGPHQPFGDRGWTKEDLEIFNVPELFLNEKKHVCDPSVRIDARMVAAASQTTENESSVIVLEAEVAREVLSRETVDRALEQWAQLLRLVVEA